MAIQVDTKDCTALGDAELAEMADICLEVGSAVGVGLLSKQREEWVLITQARDGNRLQGFVFCTLERIGGTPCLLWGVGGVKRNARRDAILKALVADQFRRAVLAFPDEDVLVGVRLAHPSSFLAFRALEDVVPRPGHKATGEERAWGRRLAKRFGAEGRLDDRTFVLKGDGNPPCILDVEALKPEAVKPDVAAFFEPLNHERGDVLLAFGWAMAEDLAGKLSGRPGK
jgi:hypothetical protein